MKPWKHVFVIYRIDDYQGNLLFTIKSVWQEENEASNETNRLNNLNEDKGCKYNYQCAKMYSGE